MATAVSRPATRAGGESAGGGAGPGSGGVGAGAGARNGAGAAPSFYLLVERGLTAFDVRAADEPPTFRARVSIGVEHRCSACRLSPQPCRHTRWVLSKLFGVARHSPLLHRAGLTEAELGALLRARSQAQAASARGGSRAQSRAGAGRQRALDGESVNWLLELSGEDAHLLMHAPARRAAPRPRPTRRPLEEGETCPICFEEMADEQDGGGGEAGEEDGALVWCKVSCGRSMHARCLAAWSVHNMNADGASVQCPLCRAAWPIGAAAAQEEARAQLESAQGVRREGLLDGLAAVDARERAADAGTAGDAPPPPSSAALRWFIRQQEAEAARATLLARISASAAGSGGGAPGAASRRASAPGLAGGTQIAGRAPPLRGALARGALPAHQLTRAGGGAIAPRAARPPLPAARSAAARAMDNGAGSGAPGYASSGALQLGGRSLSVGAGIGSRALPGAVTAHSASAVTRSSSVGRGGAAPPLPAQAYAQRANPGAAAAVRFHRAPGFGLPGIAGPAAPGGHGVPRPAARAAAGT